MTTAITPDRPFHANPAKSFTLPARYYTSADVHRGEKAAIFDRSWYYVGHRSQLRNSGDYLTATVYDQEVLVTCGHDLQLNAFYNVCKHRGHELVQGTGRVKALTCPYHAWVYSLDGSLKQARNTNNLAGFDKCDFALAPVQVEDLCGLVFVNLDEDAAPLHQQADGLADELRQYCPEIDSLELVQRDDYDVACNWKTLIDNYLECYHCAPAHRDFVDLVDMKTYRSKVNGIYSTHVSDEVRNADNGAYTLSADSADFGFAGWYLWPNLTISILPGEASMLALQMLPTETERSIQYADWFSVGGQAGPQLREAMAYVQDVLQPEDIGLCESVQKGLRSNGYNQGRFVIDDDLTELSEHAVHHFQHLVAEALDHEIIG